MFHTGSNMSPELQALQAMLVTAAQEELLPRFAKVIHSHKADGSVVTEADIAMQRRVSDQLTAGWPEYVFLGEELPATEQIRRLNAPEQGLWCLDPLDGTGNFVAGLPYFCTSLALLINREARLALVYDPVRDECFTAESGKGAWLNGERLGEHGDQTPLRESMGLIDFKRLTADLAARLIASPPYRSQRSFGASALDWCWLAAGRCHVYLHGHHMLWDYAAGSLILQEAGGQAVTLEGEAVFRPSLEPRSVAAALGGDTFREWLNWLNIRQPSTR